MRARLSNCWESHQISRRNHRIIKYRRSFSPPDWM